MAWVFAGGYGAHPGIASKQRVAAAGPGRTFVPASARTGAVARPDAGNQVIDALGDEAGGEGEERDADQPGGDRGLSIIRAMLLLPCG